MASSMLPKVKVLPPGPGVFVGVGGTGVSEGVGVGPTGVSVGVGGIGVFVGVGPPLPAVSTVSWGGLPLSRLAANKRAVSG